MRRVILFAASLAFSCAAPPSAPPASSAASTPGSPEELRTCAARGGIEAIRAGLSLERICAIPNTDEGRACADSGQCAGRCLVSFDDIQRRGPGTVAGRCAAEQSRLAGCYAEVHNGRAGPEICYD
jgi:hypothetical protein